MEQNQQPEATRAAIKQLQADFNSHAETAAKELRRLHARVEELEAMLDAVGAGGVSAPVVLPEPEAYLFQHEETGQTMFVEAQQVEWGFEANNPRLHKVSGVYTEQQVRELLAAHGITQKKRSNDKEEQQWQ